jgi:hypothetical protein
MEWGASRHPGMARYHGILAAPLPWSDGAGQTAGPAKAGVGKPRSGSTGEDSGPFDIGSASRGGIVSPPWQAKILPLFTLTRRLTRAVLSATADVSCAPAGPECAHLSHSRWGQPISRTDTGFYFKERHG